MQTLSVIIPCYNEEVVVETCYSRLKAVLEKLPLSSRLIFVNDGSEDGTKERLKSIADQDESVTLISFSRNFGHQAAVTAGIHHCDSDFAIIMDADMQDPPELIPEILEKQAEEQANVVYCVRNSRQEKKAFKVWSAKLFYKFLNKMAEVKFPLDTGDFRLIDKRIIEEFKRFKERGKYVRGIISWIGFKQVPFFYERESRIAGQTKYPLRKMFSFGGRALTYFSKRPLQIAMGLGFLSVLIGVLMGIWYICGKIFGYTDAESGWTSIMITIIFFGGVQLLTIGVLGQYIGILFEEVKGRPEYVVDEIIRKP